MLKYTLNGDSDGQSMLFTNERSAAILPLLLPFNPRKRFSSLSAWSARSINSVTKVSSFVLATDSLAAAVCRNLDKASISLKMKDVLWVFTGT